MYALLLRVYTVAACIYTVATCLSVYIDAVHRMIFSASFLSFGEEVRFARVAPRKLEK